VACINDEMKVHGFPPCALTAIFGGDRSFAFVEFQDPTDATNASNLDGVNYKGTPLKIKRPKDYVPPPGEGGAIIPLPLSGTSNNTNAAQNNPDKLFIGGIPHHLTEDQVKELLKSFGELKAFSLIMDAERKQSKGYAFCEFSDAAVADLAIEGLNNMEIGDRKLVVQRASSGAKNNQGQAPALVPTMTAAGGIGELSHVMLLLNLTSMEDIRHSADFEGTKLLLLQI
jgi:splicing factor U2AF subunit